MLSSGLTELTTSFPHMQAQPTGKGAPRDGLCTRRLMTMEQIHGKSINAAMRVQVKTSDLVLRRTAIATNT